MTKASIVKKVIGEPLKKERFIYAGYGRHRDKAWHFKRDEDREKGGYDIRKA